MTTKIAFIYSTKAKINARLIMQVFCGSGDGNPLKLLSQHPNTDPHWQRFDYPTEYLSILPLNCQDTASNSRIFHKHYLPLEALLWFLFTLHSMPF